MTAAGEFENAFHRARALHAEGRLAEAERAYRQLQIPPEHREAVLGALADLYLQAGRAEEAGRTLAALIGIAPESLNYHAALAGLLESSGRRGDAIALYESLVHRCPSMAAAHFNLALLYKKVKRMDDALRGYEKAIELGIDRVEEVWSNMGVLHAEQHRRHEAAGMYEKALAVNADYVPALFNLAGLAEEAGERAQAMELYQHILRLEPDHWEALCRLAHIRRQTRDDGPLLDAIRHALTHGAPDALAEESLYFALGKALDDLGLYDDAFAAYRSANRLGAGRNPRYRRDVVERDISALIDGFSRDWLAGHETGTDEMPVFICGMFRSGSTLVEQALSRHPAVTAGGELDFLPWLLEQKLSPFPARALASDPESLRGIAAEYMKRLHDLFPGASIITDKRPDNFLLIGLIKALFPRARIIHTQRAPMDNCLSIYFQQLGGNLSYATDLEDTAHYYQQHKRLMAHWADCLGRDLHTVDYDELVRAPEPTLRALLAFLGLDWDERCLDFRQAESLVKTASVWQVREGFYTHASGRWRHYAAHLGGLQAQFA